MLVTYPVIISCLLTLKPSSRFFFFGFCLYFLVIFSVNFRVRRYIVLFSVSCFSLFLFLIDWAFLPPLNFSSQFLICQRIVLHILYFLLVMTLEVLLYSSILKSKTEQYFNSLSKAQGVKQL